MTESLVIELPSLPDPPVALLANKFATGRTTEVAGRVHAAVEAGIAWVHLRDHDAAPDVFAGAARTLVNRLRALRPSPTITVNTQYATARSLRCGLHTGWRGPRPEAIPMPVARPLGYSAHHLLELPAPRRRAVDYVTYSPVFPTSSKPGHPGTGTAALRRFVEQVGVPVLALGGITPERVAACREAGAHGVAVLSGIMQSDAPAVAAARYVEAWRTTTAP